MKDCYYKDCPQCKNQINYSSKKSLNNSIKNNSLCKQCINKNKIKNKTNFRLCPKCGKKIIYKSYITKELAEKLTNEGKLCRSCISAEVMRGKTVYDTWVKKYGKEVADIRLQQFKNKQSENFKGEKNINYKNKCNGNKGLIEFSSNCKGKSLNEIYGDEKAHKIKMKLSKHSKGKNNPMYGKPAPKRSGNGWSGYYKNHYFRSMLELNYLIYLVDNNIKFESGEKRKHAIKYTMDGIERNYFPDYYLVDTDEYVEIKPKSMVNSYQNKLKFKAAKSVLNNKFIILTEEDIVKINLNNLYNKYMNKQISFDEGYDKKFENYCNGRIDIK